MSSRAANGIARMAVFALAAALAGCGSVGGTHTDRTATLHEHHRVSPEDSAEVFLSYPVWSSRSHPAVAESLNAWTRGHLLAEAIGDAAIGGVLPDTTALIETILTASARDHGEFPESGPWSLNRWVEVLADTFGIVSLSFSESSYTGGAHPLSQRRLASFDARTGRTFGLDEAFVPGARDSLNAAAEAAFRASRGIAPGADLGDEGFWFEGNRFVVPEAFAVERRGLLFHFDPYEVGPYALGPTDFVVPWDALRRWLRADGPLAAAAAPPS